MNENALEGIYLEVIWKKFSEDEEKLVFQWLIHEIILKLKERESRGECNFNFLTKTKTQKMLFQISEECYLDLTRMWYMFGGMVFAPFNIMDKAGEYYYNHSSLTKSELNESEKLLGSRCIKHIKETFSKIFENIFNKKMEDYLVEFYENKAPPLYKDLYSHFRSIQTLYRGIINPQIQLDFHLRSILPNFTPWKDVLKMQHHISEFQVEVAGIFDEYELQIIMEFTRLLENVAIQISWMKYRKINITTSHENIINTLLDEFTNIGWKYLAKTIGIETVRGTNAKKWRESYLKQRKSLKKTVQYSLLKLQKEISKLDLHPDVEVISDFFKREYKKMFDEAMGASIDFEDQSNKRETIKRY